MTKKLTKKESRMAFLMNRLEMRKEKNELKRTLEKAQNANFDNADTSKFMRDAQNKALQELCDSLKNTLKDRTLFMNEQENTKTTLDEWKEMQAKGDK